MPTELLQAENDERAAEDDPQREVLALESLAAIVAAAPGLNLEFRLATLAVFVALALLGRNERAGAVLTQGDGWRMQRASCD